MSAPTAIPPLALAAADASSLITWIGALIGVIILATAVLLFIRSRMSAHTQYQDQTGTIMDEFRRMRDDGRLTPEEYEATRARLKDRLAASIAKPEANPATPGINSTNAHTTSARVIKHTQLGISPARPNNPPKPNKPT